MTLSDELLEEPRQLFLLMDHLHNNPAYPLYNKMLIASNKDHLSRSTYIAAKGTTTVAVTRLDGIAASEAE